MKGRHTHGGIRRLLTPVALFVCAFLVASAGAAFAFLSATGSGSASAKATTLGAGSQPAAIVSGRDVSLSWGTFTNATSYTVSRSNVAPQSLATTLNGSCAGPPTTNSCADNGLPENGTGATNWTYAETPNVHSWVGVASPASATVSIPAPALSMTTTTFPTVGGTTSATVAHYYDNEAVTYCVDHDTTTCPSGNQTSPATVSVPGTTGTVTSSSLSIPSGLAVGTHTLYAKGSLGSDPAGAAFTISPASITIGTTSNVTVGSTDSVSGTGFPASKAVSLNWDGAGITFSVSVTTNSSGAFTATNFTVPQAVAGTHTVGAAAGNIYTTATLTVVPKISVNAGSGLAQTSASVGGAGFAAGSTISATFNGSALTLSAPGGGSPTTDTFGSFSDAVFTIPSNATGNYNLIVKDVPGNTAPTVSFAETSNSSYASATSGLTATQATTTMSGLVNIGGPCTNCAKSEAFNVYVDGILAVGQVTTSTNKSWSTGSGEVIAFGLPAGITNGTHSVAIVDSSGLVYGTTILTMSTTFLAASPTSGAPGTSISLTGAAHTVDNNAGFSTFFDIASEGTGTGSSTGTTTSPAFNVPTGWGTHLIYLKQTSGTHVNYFTPAVSFVVPLPNMGATPTSGFISGHTVTLAGAGFANSSTISATYAGLSVTLSSSSVSATGTFSGVTFTLPTETASTYPLIVTDGSTNSFVVGINQTG